MHVRSFLPIAGLTLIPLVSSASVPHGLFKRDNLTVSTKLPSPWTYSGCYSDSVQSRALPLDQYYDNTAMSEESCIQYCGSKGYSIAGVEYGRECYCGYVLGSSAVKRDESECDMACTGNFKERCGGSSRMNVFSNGDPAPKTNPGVNSYSLVGCYTDSVSARTLNTSSGSSGSMTVSICTATCGSAGFVYAGVEYGTECFCGNALQNDASQVTDGCNMVCTGNKTEYCGGSARMNLYQSTAPPEQLYNSGFEAGGSGWTVSPSPDGANGLAGTFQSDNTYAHAGHGYFLVSGSQFSGVTGKRGICLDKDVYINQPGLYRLSFYVGGVNQFKPDPRSNIPPQYSLTFSANIAGSAFSGSVCESGCPVQNVGGSAAYAYNSYSLTLSRGYQRLTICANYDGIRRGQDDLFYLDDVSLVGAF